MVAEQGSQGEQRVVASQAYILRSSVIVVVALAVVVVASS